jgi:secreted PhoX family phosphatase
MKFKALSLAVSMAVSGSALAATLPDFGQLVEASLKAGSLTLFGVKAPLDASSSVSLDAATVEGKPTSLVTLASGLTAKVVSAAPNLGANIDQMALWPNDNKPTHLIACNEQGTAQVALQSIKISDGSVTDIVVGGLNSCDPVRRTAWGTIIFGEESGANGRMFELLDPLNTTGITVSGAGATTLVSDPTKVAYLAALGQLSFEGLALYPNGVVYYGDEKRPGTGNGGAYFKFIPTTPWTGGAITDLSQSPLASGKIYGMRLGRNGAAPNSNTDIGQGNEFGRGFWVEVVDGQVIGATTINRVNLQAAATALKLTSYYRPEDMDIDLKKLAAGEVRFCGNNTGQDANNGDNHWGETFCITDGTLALSTDTTTAPQTIGGVVYNMLVNSTPEYQILNLGHKDFGMPDNIAYQPGRGNWLINEDGDGATYTPARNNDIWSCLDDGADKDILSDGCVKVISINDLTAETTGGIFDATGKRYFVSVQHNITGHGVVLEIDGWK